MPWLLCDGRRVAPLELALHGGATSTGLLGRDAIAGALLLDPAHWIHTFGMRFPLDVAFCDNDLTVVEVISVGRNRMCRPRLMSTSVLEAPRHAFDDWNLVRGSQLRVEDG